MSTTAGVRAYDTIRGLILQGRFAPGMRLREEELTEVCGTSRTPVREALRRLSAEGLLVKNPRLGAQVAAMDTADLEEIYALRAMVESHAAARAAERITPGQLARMKALAAEMEAAETLGDQPLKDGFIQANSEFHRIILEAADSPRLTTMASLVVELPLTLRTLARYSSEDRQRSHRHHRELIATLEARDPRWAAAVMKSHIYAAYQTLALTFRT